MGRSMALRRYSAIQEPAFPESAACQSRRIWRRLLVGGAFASSPVSFRRPPLFVDRSADDLDHGLAYLEEGLGLRVARERIAHPSPASSAIRNADSESSSSVSLGMI